MIIDYKNRNVPGSQWKLSDFHLRGLVTLYLVPPWNLLQVCRSVCMAFIQSLIHIHIHWFVHSFRTCCQTCPHQPCWLSGSVGDASRGSPTVGKAVRLRTGSAQSYPTWSRCSSEVCRWRSSPANQHWPGLCCAHGALRLKNNSWSHILFQQTIIMIIIHLICKRFFKRPEDTVRLKDKTCLDTHMSLR